MICHVANIHYTIARHYNIVILRRICQWLCVVRVDHHRYNCVLLSQYVLDLVVNCLRQAFPRQALATRYYGEAPYDGEASPVAATAS